MLSSILLISCLLAGDPAGNGISKAEVDNLVLMLDAKEKDVRQAAEERLIKQGSAVLNLLPPPGAQPLGVEKALDRIRKTLQSAKAQASTEASTVTLHGRLKLSAVLAEIQKQTGNTIAAQPQPAEIPAADPDIEVNFNKTPFWTALDTVLDQAQLSVYPYGQPGALLLVPRGPHNLPRVGRAAVSGPFRIEPVRVTAIRDLRSATPSSLQVTLEVSWEPRLQPIAITQRSADLKVVDSTGAAVSPDEGEKESPLPRQGTSALEMDVAMAMPAQGAKEIASLKGSLQVMMLGRIETFDFDDLLKDKPKSKRIAAATVALSARKNGEAWEFFVQLSYSKAGAALESHRNWALQNKAFLEGPNGKPIEPDSMETTLRTPTEIGVGYVFALDKGSSPANMKFVYKAPGLIATKDFPFELKGIKLP